jgi:hypothetical protein
LRQLLADRPGDAVIQNALGYTLADRTRHADEAVQLVGQALTQTPDSAAVLDSMGWALHKQGKNTEALDYLERARKRGADPEIDLHVGEVHWSLDDKAACARDVAEGSRALARRRESSRIGWSAPASERRVAAWLVTGLLAGCAATPPTVIGPPELPGADWPRRGPSTDAWRSMSDSRAAAARSSGGRTARRAGLRCEGRSASGPST